MLQTQTRTCARAWGFSLIELLVVIAIVAVLISIALPAIAAARVAGRRTVALSNARTVAQGFELYTGEHDGAYPFVEPINDTSLPNSTGIVYVRWYPAGVLIGSSDPFTLSWAWPALLSSVLPWEANYETWVSPGLGRALPEAPAEGSPEHRPDNDISWRLSRSFLADPKAWREGASPTPTDIHGVRTSEVALPAQKVMLWDTHLAYLPREPEVREGHWDAQTPAAFADGHAALVRPQAASEPVATPFGMFVDGSGPDGVKLHDTAGGVRGADY